MDVQVIPVCWPERVQSWKDSPTRIVRQRTWSGARLSIANMLFCSRRRRVTEAVAYTFNGWSSRRSSKPRTWSRSALANTTPDKGELFVPSRGCNSGVASIWERRSGDAPSKNQDFPSSLTATCAWERTLPGNLPLRTSWQFGHAQFHWGKPPPAAEPRIFTYMEERL